MAYGNVAICGSCWVDLNGRREPVTVKTDESQTCYRCGLPTTAGIYVRRYIDDDGELDRFRAEHRGRP